MVFLKTYSAPPLSGKEVLRYAGVNKPDGLAENMLRDIKEEALNAVSYKVCFAVFDVKVNGGVCDFGAFTLTSNDLSKTLSGCKRAVVFAATAGIGIDRLIARYGTASPAKALMLDAFGSERIEALCDTFCGDFTKENGVFLKPRFSPGYGDLELGAQKEIFKALDCQKNIGLTLTESLVMMPSKSVTAIAGIADRVCTKNSNKCETCKRENCEFRSVL